MVGGAVASALVSPIAAGLAATGVGAPVAAALEVGAYGAGSYLGDVGYDKFARSDMGKKAIDAVGQGASKVAGALGIGAGGQEVAKQGAQWLATPDDEDAGRTATSTGLGMAAKAAQYFPAGKALTALEKLGPQAVKLAQKFGPEAEQMMLTKGSSAMQALQKYGSKAIQGAEEVVSNQTGLAGKAIQKGWDTAKGAVKGAIADPSKAVKTAKTANFIDNVTPDASTLMTMVNQGMDANEIIQQHPQAKAAAEELLKKGIQDPTTRNALLAVAGAGLAGAAYAKTHGGQKKAAKDAIAQARQGVSDYQATQAGQAPTQAPARAPVAEPQDRYLSRDAFRSQTKKGAYQPPKRVKPGQEPAPVQQPRAAQPQQQAPTASTTAAPATATATPSANAGHSQSLKKAKAQPTKASRRGNTKIRSPRKVREGLAEDIDLTRLKNLAGIRQDDN